jgi:hypothetical protein
MEKAVPFLGSSWKNKYVVAVLRAEIDHARKDNEKTTWRLRRPGLAMFRN